MKTSTVIIAGKALGKVVNRAVKYFRDEASGNYALLEPVEISVSGEGAGGVNWRNDVLEIVSANADAVTFRVVPFPASTGYWNGPSVVADFDDGRIEASLFHDLIWTWSAEIAEANGMTEAELLTWSNLHLAVMWREYGKRHGAWGWAVRFKSWLAANVCGSWLSRVWRRIVSLVMVSLMIGGCAGCIGIPDWTVDDAGAVEYEKPEGGAND